MRLLICTQAIDKNDPALGFFVSWVREFARHFEKITVVCLYRGEYALPENVRVFSLGKESSVNFSAKGGSASGRQFSNTLLQRAIYVFRFKRLMWRHRHEYDAVFLHMNAEYAVLGGVLWRLLGKKVALWYNHPARHWKVRLGALLAHRVFCTSEKSFTARYSKTRRMPVGIDTDLFRREEGGMRKPRTILSLGRISKYKRIHVLIDGLALLAERGISLSAHIYGNAPPEERAYGDAMREKARLLEDMGVVRWHKGVSHESTPALFNEHEIFANLSQAGNFDKTILEAMACEALVFTCNPVLQSILPPECFFEEDNAVDFADKATKLLDLPEETRRAYGIRLRDYVVREHTLMALAKKLRDELTSL